MEEIERALARPAGEVRLVLTDATLAPLARAGDAVRVRGCPAEALRPGDLALLRLGGKWYVRLVAGTRPLRAATLRGPAAPWPGEARGRVVALERRGAPRAWKPSDRLRALFLHRFVFGWGAAAARRLRDRARALAPARVLRGRRTGGVRVRRLDEGDRAALDAFLVLHLPHLRELAARQLGGRWSREGVAVGAFAGDGAMVGFTFLDAYTEEGVELPGAWVRALAVAPRARRLGVGRALVEALCREGASTGIPRAHADVRRENRASLALFHGLGFREAAPELASRAAAALSSRDGGAASVVLTRELSPGPPRRIARISGAR